MTPAQIADPLQQADHIFWLVTKDPLNHNNADRFEKILLRTYSQLEALKLKGTTNETL